MNRPIRRALLSVSDKSGLVELATELHQKYQVELIATGGTLKTLRDAKLPARDISELTQFPEILDGRVKTLHPAVYAGLLAKRSKPEHMATLKEHNLLELDLVVCNLYPFSKVVAKPDVTEAEAIENIDIGGPCMVRAAAKNFDAVAVLPDPTLYDEFLEILAENNGACPREFRHELASIAFQLVRQYDEAIEDYFLNRLSEGDDESDAENRSEDADDESIEWDDEFDPPFNLKQTLRYGENPHQQAAFYVEPELQRPCIATAEQLHGKELSYNNILDLDAAINVVREFTEPAAVVVKHNNPCGAATASKLVDAFQAAWDGDSLSAFGGIIAVNQTLDRLTAEALMSGERFVECVVAPEFDADALAVLKTWKKNVRLLRTGPWRESIPGLDYRRVDGGLLVQTRDVDADDPNAWEVKTKRQPTAEERAALWFAWRVCKHVKSNAIVLASATSIVGVGAGQMSRVVSVEIATRKAGPRAKGSVLASDAFFPFPDNVELAAAAGVTAIVQPGGSVKDAESIAACDQHNIAMLFTGVRHFRH